MKKIFLIVFAAVGLMTFVSCSNKDFDEKYADPSKTTTVSVPQVFTGVLQAGNTWMNPVYFRYYTQSTTSGCFSGVIGNTNSRGRFRGASEGYFNTRWQNFYNMLTQYRLLEDTYNNLDDDQKAANQIFLYLGRTIMQAQLHEVLSIWGDVPYSGACTLWKTGNYEEAKSLDKYDDDVQVYTQILTDLKEVGDILVGLAHVVEVGIVLAHASLEGAEILMVVEHDGVGVLAVAPRPPSLLKVGLDGVGHIVVDDKPHVRLVDAHAESVGGNHHTDTVLSPIDLAVVLLGVGQSGVVIAGGDAVLLEESGDIDGLLAGASIDDGTSVGHSLQDVEHLPCPVLGLAHHVDEVLALETHREDVLRTESEPLLNVIDDLRRGRGRERQHRHVVGRKQLPNPRYPKVGRTEIVAPLRDAMSLVHHNHAQLLHALELGDEEIGGEAFGRDVEEFVSAQDRIVEHPDDVVAHHSRIDRLSLDAPALELLHLVFHQRDEWRDDDAESFAHQCRHLETDALSTTRRHQRQRVTPTENALDDLALNATKRVIAPVLLENV